MNTIFMNLKSSKPCDLGLLCSLLDKINLKKSD